MAHIRTSNERCETQWEKAVEYLASHAGHWVTGEELSAAVYGGHCSNAAVRVLVYRARRDHHFQIYSSNAYGYRMGRADAAASLCAKCGKLRVRYPDEWVCYGCPGTRHVDLEVGRAAYDEDSNQGNHWSEEEDAFIRANMNRMNDDEMAKALNRSHSGVRGRRGTLGLGPKQYVKARTE